ncbi:MAG: DUF167 domain-containing protein [Nanobdellota archaeon]
MMDFSKPVHILVRAGARETKVKEFDPDRSAWRVDVKAAPEKGKANQEIVRFFEKKSGMNVRISSGTSSKRKTLRFE